MQREVSGSQACDRWKKLVRWSVVCPVLPLSSMPRTQSFNITRKTLRPKESKDLDGKSLALSYGTPTTDTQVPSPKCHCLYSLTHSRGHKSSHIKKYHCSHILYLRAWCRNEKVSRNGPCTINLATFQLSNRKLVFDETVKTIKAQFLRCNVRKFWRFWFVRTSLGLNYSFYLLCPGVYWIY